MILEKLLHHFIHQLLKKSLSQKKFISRNFRPSKNVALSQKILNPKNVIIIPSQKNISPPIKWFWKNCFTTSFISSQKKIIFFISYRYTSLPLPSHLLKKNNMNERGFFLNFFWKKGYCSRLPLRWNSLPSKK